MKATPLCTLIIEGVCDCLSSGEGKKWAPPIRPHLGWIAKQELAGAILEGLVGCARSSDASLLEHMQNLSRIFLHYDPTQVWRAACRAAGYSGIHQVNQPFIMNAGVWRAEINFIFRALYFTNKKKCHYSPSIAKLNYITTVLILLAHMWAPTLSPTQTVDMWTLTVRWHSSWPAWHPFTNCSLVQQHILKCSSSAGDQQGKQQWGKCQCLLWRSGVSFSCFISI